MNRTADSPLRDASDEDLVALVRSGDDRAGAELLSRHRVAVTAVGGDGTQDEVAHSGSAALTMVRSGCAVPLPFRALWLAVHTRGGLPPTPVHDRAVWSAFLSLPAGWRTAVWHREVEGESPRTSARFLGMSEEQTTRALTLSYAALKCSTAAAHDSVGSSSSCRQIAATYRLSSPPALARHEIRTLREHARRCDDCLELIRQLFLIENALRDVLAVAVMGADAAEAYLDRRPRPKRLRLPLVEGSLAFEGGRRPTSPRSGTSAAARLSARLEEPSR